MTIFITIYLIVGITYFLYHNHNYPVSQFYKDVERYSRQNNQRIPSYNTIIVAVLLSTVLMWPYILFTKLLKRFN